MAFDIKMIKEVYQKYSKAIESARRVTNKPLTLSEKILYTHLWEGKATNSFTRGKDYVNFAPDRVAIMISLLLQNIQQYILSHLLQ